MPAAPEPPGSRGSGSDADLRVGYLIPEFPGQTHTWIWREIVWMRRFGVSVELFSTRRPPARDAARHAFADEARRLTFYLSPMGFLGATAALFWGLLHPWGLFRSIGLALRLPVDKGPRWKRVLPLVLPACRFAREVRRRGIQRLHAHSCASSAILCMMVRRLTGVPFSMTLNADVGWWGGAMAEKMADADFTIAITQRLLEEAKGTAPDLRPDQILLGRIGVDTSAWAPGGNRAPSPVRRIASVSRLHYFKGHDTLIQAVEILAGRGIKLELRIAGEGPQRQELEDQVARAGLKETVTFLGSLPEERIIDLLEWADVFVLASHAEPLGVVYMEAMSMQVPVVGTNAGGVTEIITDGVDGLLVAPKDPQALAAAIEKVLADGGLRIRLALAARKTIIQRFDSRIGAATLYERMKGTPPVVRDAAKHS